MSKERNPDALIRIEDAIKVLCWETCCPGACCPDGYCVEKWDKFEDVERVDAVPVVRCRDCEYKDRESGFCHGRGWPMQLVPDDGFCDKGKRKGGPDEH